MDSLSKGGQERKLTRQGLRNQASHERNAGEQRKEKKRQLQHARRRRQDPIDPKSLSSHFPGGSLFFFCLLRLGLATATKTVPARLLCAWYPVVRAIGHQKGDYPSHLPSACLPAPILLAAAKRRLSSVRYQSIGKLKIPSQMRPLPFSFFLVTPSHLHAAFPSNFTSYLSLLLQITISTSPYCCAKSSEASGNDINTQSNISEKKERLYRPGLCILLESDLVPRHSSCWESGRVETRESPGGLRRNRKRRPARACAIH